MPVTFGLTFGPKQLAVREIARSGQPDELLEKYGISANHIIKAVKSLL